VEFEKKPEISIESEMKKSYLDYAMSVIIGRALPDVRDGLKPVHRRVLFAMRDLKNDYNKPYKKSARIVGDVIGKYHPHGDSAVYDTIVRMAQDFAMRYPLVDGQGNFGSVDGDPAAAMRYTEIRMQRVSHELMDDLEKETVDFVPNYDESLTEPSVIPAKVPLLLVNGSAGIAVGMATNIPPHNLSETIDAITALIDNPEISWQELMNHIPGPDFPTGGIIYGTRGIYEAYRSGRGVIRIRARLDVEQEKKSGMETIVVHELPYQVNKARLIEKIAGLIRGKQIEGIRYVRDESDRRGMRIAIALKKDVMAEVVMNLLYKHTQLETSFGIILLAVVNQRPQLLSLKEVLEHYVLHRKEIVVRRTRFDLKKAEARAHILEGLKIALDNLDEVVALIRKASSPAEAKTQLMERFKLTDVQAQAILDMRLQRLTGLERDKIIEEYQNVLKDIARFKEILASEQLVLNIIKDELTDIKERFGDERRSRIVEATRELTMADMIAEEDMVVTVSQEGYIKRNPITLYQSQRRGGKGKTAMGVKDEDFVKHLFVASTHHTFMFFTNMGRVYWCKVYDIPQAGRASRGKAIVNLLNFTEGEQLTTVLAVPEYEPGYHIMMATRNGQVKKTDLMAFSRPRVGGIIALNLAEDDELVSARIVDGTMNVFLGSAFGKSIRFHETDVRPTGRVAGGIRGMSLESGDRIVGMEVLSYGQTLFAVTENGYGKRTSIDEYPLQKRGGKGVITIKTNERNGKVVSILLVEETDGVMLMTDSGKIIRMPIEGVSVISRNTQGVKLMGMAPGERMAGAARLAEQEEDDADVDGGETPDDAGGEPSEDAGDEG
jgi:DNA gyrase subunit A